MCRKSDYSLLFCANKGIIRSYFVKVLESWILTAYNRTYQRMRSSSWDRV